MGEMSTTEKAVNLGAVVIPFIATLTAIVLLWNSWVTAADLIIAAVMYLLTAVGITVVYCGFRLASGSVKPLRVAESHGE